MEKESAKAKETAKKKLTRKANPQEAYPRPSEEKVFSDEKLADTVDPGADESLTHGYKRLDLDLDTFDNERNYDRMRPEEYSESKDPHPDERSYNKECPSPGYGPKKKGLDQEGEDYGQTNVKESSHLDD